MRHGGRVAARERHGAFISADNPHYLLWVRLTRCRLAQHRGYGFLEFAEESFATNAIQHMNGFELAGQSLKVGKASPAAMLINLAISTDKVVHDGKSGGEPGGAPIQKTFDEDDVEAVKDVDGEEKRCVCLLNLVNKGEVDNELEGEVRIECSKYGAVKTVQIRELSDHVRIFVEFDVEEGAATAKQALNGRFFGGNQVQAHFYSLRELEHQRYTSTFL
jgi:RNA recognition motif-containing protein